MKKPRPTKAMCQRMHAKKRLAQRYGLEVNRHDLREMVGLIQACKGTFLYRHSLRVTVWQIEWRGTILKLVYDTNRGEIVTALPLGPES